MVTIIFNSVNTVKPQLSPLWFLVRVFSLHPCRERKITSVQNSMRTGGKREEVGWGFTEEHVHSHFPSAETRRRSPGIHARTRRCCDVRERGGASVDWTRGVGRGNRKSLWEERKVSRLGVSLPLVLTLDLEDLVTQVGLDVVFAVGRQN